MNLGTIIIIAILTLLLLYIIFKPYFIKYNTTLLFTGGLGTGKTLNAVKIGIRCYKKNAFKIKIKNYFIKKINKLKKHHNDRKTKQYEKGKKANIKYWQIKELHEIPRLITNIPVLIKKRKGKQIWSTQLTKDMMLLKQRIPEYSIVLIDELPQLVNQFNWNIKEVQYNVNEFATFFRHYIDGKLIMTGQADSEIVKQIRSKMNTYFHLSNFKKLFHFFYKCDICQFVASEIVDNVSIGFYEDNVKTTYGTLFTKHYDSRCYSQRYDKLPQCEYHVWNKYKTKTIIRFDEKYISPLDPPKNEQFKCNYINPNKRNCIKKIKQMKKQPSKFKQQTSNKIFIIRLKLALKKASITEVNEVYKIAELELKRR